MKKLRKAQKLGTFDPTKVNLFNPPKQYYPASDRTNVPARKLSVEEEAQLKKEAAEATRLKKLYEQQELDRRKQAIAASNKALMDEPSLKNLAIATSSLGERVRLFPDDPNSFIDDYLNPAADLANITGSLFQVPYNLQQGDYKQAAVNIAVPAATALLARIGAKGAGQYINNLVNPFAGLNVRGLKEAAFPHITNSRVRQPRITPNPLGEEQYITIPLENNTFDLERLRNIHHNNQRSLTSQEIDFLDNYGRGLRADYRNYNLNNNSYGVFNFQNTSVFDNLHKSVINKLSKYSITNIKNRLRSVDKALGDYLFANKDIDYNKLEDSINNLLEKGTGVKKADIPIKVKVNNRTLQVYIDPLKNNNFMFSGQILLKPYNIQGIPFSEKLDDILNSSPFSIFSTNVKGLEKVIDYPTNMVRKSSIFPSNIDITGIGGELGEAIKKAIKEQNINYDLVSSTSHSESGALRYLNEFINNRKKVLDPGFNKEWLKAANKLKAQYPEGIKKEELESILKNFPELFLPRDARFLYNKGGIVKSNYLKASAVEEMQDGGFFSTPTTGVPYQDKEYMYQEGGNTDYNLNRAKELGYTADEAGHLPSVDYTTGMWLKSKKHPTAFLEYLEAILNPELQNQQVVVNPEGYFGEEQLQYIPRKKQGGEMIRRKDGSYSRRGLWDNIRENRGSGKKPTAEMLKQEKKIRNEEKKYGGSLPTYQKAGSVTTSDKSSSNVPNFLSFLTDITKDTFIDQLPLSTPYNVGKAINAGRPFTAISEFVKSPLPFLGDAVINILQENPTKYSIKNLEDNIVPYGRLVNSAVTRLATGETPIITEIGNQIILSGEKPNSKWYSRDFNLPDLITAAKKYNVDHNTFVEFIESNWDKSGKNYKKILELADKTFRKKEMGGSLPTSTLGVPYQDKKYFANTSKYQIGGNIYDKETDNLLAQIASMIADGEDPDMVAGSLVDNGYSEEVVDSLVEEAIDRLTELGDYEEEDINQLEDIKVLREGGIPDRYKNQGFTKVGAKRKSNRPGKKWMVLAKKGNKYKIVHGGYKGMKDYTQHGSEERRERFWDRMGGKNSSKAKDPFSPLYWHKRFGTWQDGGKTPIEDPEGQRKYPGKTTRIPSNRITMEGINYPVLAIGDNGKANLMLPGEEYLYLGVNYVDEVPFSK